MPELPEVETVRRGLEEILLTKPVLKKIELLRPDLRFPIPAKQMKILIGQPIVSVERRAKYLLLHTPKGSLLSHLGMTGTWRVAAKGEERLHDHIYLHFEDGLRLAYRDPRRFGVFDFVPLAQLPKQFELLGPEPLHESFTGESLWQCLRGKQTSIKVAVMDQRVVVGVGNIYACEALYAAGLRPHRRASTVTKQQAHLLVSEIKKILIRAIEHGGSSISDFASTNGSSGYFQNTFSVYARAKQPCQKCQKIIKSEIIGGRNSFWCASCQK